MDANLPTLRITEFDGANNVTATYVGSGGGGDGKGIRRFDIIPPSMSRWSLQTLLDVFLPAGYPHSVTTDYMEYQIYDSLQAFASSIAGLLSSRALLSSAGVGDASASPTAAVVLSIVQESVSRVATIVFAHRFGSAFEPECKRYRLLADVLNDAGFVLDCVSPALPQPLRATVLVLGSLLRALCGVAAGSAKASLSAHFAAGGNNIAELNAKDASQETVISLLGMWAGSLLVARLTSASATAIALILLLGAHLETNRRAVRAVALPTLNRQRATLVFHRLRSVGNGDGGHVPSPLEISRAERIFERDAVLRGAAGQDLGSCAVGVHVRRLFAALETDSPQNTTKSLRVDPAALLRLFPGQQKQKMHILYHEPSGRDGRRRLFLLLRRGAGPRDALLGWWQALAVAQEEGPITPESLRAADAIAADLLRTYEARLAELGWNLDVGALETRVGVRVEVEM